MNSRPLYQRVLIVFCYLMAAPYILVGCLVDYSCQKFNTFRRNR